MLVFRGREGPWSVAGNGGKMAEARQKLSGDKANGKTSSKNEGKRASREKRARKNGAERLRLAVDKRLGQNSETLANLLTNQAMGGDVAIAKALVELAEGKKPRPEPRKKRRGPTAAELLMADIKQHGQWQDEQEEGSAETGGGGVEAEG
jgi:hypothetical protein